MGILLLVLGLADVMAAAAEKETGDKKSLKAVADTRDGSGKTPLRRAAGKGHTAEIKALIAAGADVNVIDRAYDSLLHRKQTRFFDGYDKQRMARVEAVEKIYRDARGKE